MTTLVDVIRAARGETHYQHRLGGWKCFQEEMGKKYASEDSPRGPKTQAKGRRKASFKAADTALLQPGSTWPLNSCGRLGLSHAGHLTFLPMSSPERLLHHEALSTLITFLPSSEISGPKGLELTRKHLNSAPVFLGCSSLSPRIPDPGGQGYTDFPLPEWTGHQQNRCPQEPAGNT